jgi:membrane protease YdiL (CAAX protease family)
MPGPDLTPSSSGRTDPAVGAVSTPPLARPLVPQPVHDAPSLTPACDASAQHAPPDVIARPVAYPPAPPPTNPLLLQPVPPRDALLDAGLLVLVGVFAPYLMPLLLHALGAAAELETVDSSVVLFKWTEALLVIGLAAYLILRQRLSPAAFGLRRDHSLRQVLWSAPTLLGVYGAMLATAPLILLITMSSKAAREDVMQRLEFAERLPTGDPLLAVLLLIPVAIHEELLFRGLLLPCLRRALGSWPRAIIVSAVLFGSLHVPQGLLGALQITTLGIVFGLFFVLTRSVVPLILAHFAFDFLQLQLLRVLPDLQRMLEKPS